MEREEVIAELQRVANLIGKQAVSRREFQRRARFSYAVVDRTFGSWNKGIEAAGLAPDTKRAGIPDSDLEAEFRRVQEILGEVPTSDEFSAHTNLSVDVYQRRFGRWSKAVEHYTGVPAATPQAKPKASTDGSQEKPIGERPEALLGAGGKRVFGTPLDFRGLRHEPVNEQGVVFVFGMVARDFGFLVEAVAIAYPDCTAKRKVRGGYIAVNIEFEFKSSNFREHGHDPSQCDLIVCWEHDWPECPVEVLELKSKLRELDARE